MLSPNEKCLHIHASAHTPTNTQKYKHTHTHARAYSQTCTHLRRCNLISTHASWRGYDCVYEARFCWCHVNRHHREIYTTLLSAAPLCFLAKETPHCFSSVHLPKHTVGITEIAGSNAGQFILFQIIQAAKCAARPRHNQHVKRRKLSNIDQELFCSDFIF